MTQEEELVASITASGTSQRAALEIVGLSRSTWHYRHHPRQAVADPLAQSARAYPSRISDQDRQEIAVRVQAAWVKGESVDQAFATAWDQGVMLASRRSWWRVAAAIENQDQRPQVPVKKATSPPRSKPVVKATAPGQVWSWDITDLYSPWRHVVYKAYKITDIFSRQIVGWRVEEREADHLAAQMFATAIAEHGAPGLVHADNGAAMKSSLLRDLLAEQHAITLTHNRPHVSDDNPFSEAGFRTMKYRPDYPRIFEDLTHARDYLAGYVPWYNHEHKHSGIALFSPAQVHDGSWRQAWQTRESALQDYYQAHPERFRARPTTPAPAGIVGINLPTTTPLAIAG